jgi:hypothetical protein
MTPHRRQALAQLGQGAHIKRPLNVHLIGYLPTQRVVFGLYSLVFVPLPI